MKKETKRKLLLFVVFLLVALGTTYVIVPTAQGDTYQDKNATGACI